MARKRRFSEDPFGPTVERLMNEAGLTYSDDVMETLARALGVEAEHFREYRLRVITDRLERMPDLIDKLYRRYGT